MGYILIIGKLILAALNIFTTRNKELKRKKRAALEEVTSGIKKKDVSRITAGFSRLNRVH